MGVFKDRSDYFKGLANLNKQVAHDRFVSGSSGPKRKSYFRLNDEEELTAACTNWAHFPCVVHFGYSGRYSENPNEVRKRETVNDLLILQKITSPADMASLENAKDMTFAIVEDFVNKILEDAEQEGYCGPFANVNMGMFSFSEYGPVNSTLYGWKLTFNDESFPGEFDDSKWYDS